VAPVRALAGRTVDQASVIVGALTSDTISERVSKAYRRHLFGDATLQDLPDHPRFVLNATSVQSGVLWRFSKPYMADWRVGRVERPTVALADAVAASSAFPPVLSPFELDLRDADWVDEPGNDLGHGEYRERAVLSDGGVYDNLGLETAWKACRTVLVSDAGGQMAAEPDPDHDWGRHLFRVLGVVDNQVRDLRKRQCVQGFIAGERLGAYWGIRTDIADFGLADPLPAPYGATLRLAMLPTRLARLDAEVQERLINWGYAACDAGMRAHVDLELPRPGGVPYPASGVGSA
jgi:NTE family protein